MYRWLIAIVLAAGCERGAHGPIELDDNLLSHLALIAPHCGPRGPDVQPCRSLDGVELWIRFHEGKVRFIVFDFGTASDAVVIEKLRTALAGTVDPKLIDLIGEHIADKESKPWQQDGVQVEMHRSSITMLVHVRWMWL